MYIRRPPHIIHTAYNMCETISHISIAFYVFHAESYLNNLILSSSDLFPHFTKISSNFKKSLGKISSVANILNNK
jgi:hypothetical protein